MIPISVGTASVVESRFGRVIGVVARNHALTRLLLAYLVMVVAEFGEWLASSSTPTFAVALPRRAWW